MRTRWLFLGAPLLLLLNSASAVSGADCTIPSTSERAILAKPHDAIANYPVRVTVNEVRFVIPRNYFDYPPRGCDSVQPAFLLRALLPNFDGSSAETDREFRHVGGGWGRVVSILVKNVIQSRGANNEPDLEGFLVIWARHPSALKWSDDKAYGLESATYQSSVSKWDLFVQREGKTVAHVMRCISAEAARFPYCQSVLFFRGTQVVLYFDRSRLADWKLIRDGVVSLLERFSHTETEPGLRSKLR